MGAELDAMLLRAKALFSAHLAGEALVYYRALAEGLVERKVEWKGQLAQRLEVASGE